MYINCINNNFMHVFYVIKLKINFSSKVTFSNLQRRSKSKVIEPTNQQPIILELSREIKKYSIT